MSQNYVLFESAAGYLLLHVLQWEEIAQNTSILEASIADAHRFMKMMKFVAFHPFVNAEEALENMKGIAESTATQLLINFLRMNLPVEKKKKYQLLVSDAVLGNSLSGEGISVGYSGVGVEIIRGCRMHFQKIVKGMEKMDVGKFQVGLGHSYSRTKIQFDPNRQDKPIMQSIALLDSLDKNVNKFAMRIREWYGWHFPELGKILSDHKVYCEAVLLIGLRDTFTESGESALTSITQSDEISKEVMNAMKVTMGQEISPLDLTNIQNFSTQLLRLCTQREHLLQFLTSKLQTVAPNLQALLGDILSARLISHAGSLMSLAKYPASTIQILGAEKALFRALKTKSNTPKYGLLYQSTWIGQSAQKHKGKISRYLANKCSLAARIDTFNTIQSNTFGLNMKSQVEERLKFLIDGIKPRKNVDVMENAVGEYQLWVKQINKNKKKEKKIQKKLEAEKLAAESASSSNNLLLDAVEVSTSSTKEKKKRKKLKEQKSSVDDDTSELEISEKKKKKKLKLN